MVEWEGLIKRRIKTLIINYPIVTKVTNYCNLLIKKQPQFLLGTVAAMCNKIISYAITNSCSLSSASLSFDASLPPA